jgi:diguanylate cyclase (GGDEF)-like protein/PAS domain S-box-containing protein
LKSSPEVRRWLSALTPRSIVARTSISILVLAVLMGLAFSLMASARMERAEHDRLRARVDELASTVESTVSVACYLNDPTLAREIGTGLLKNRVIGGVRISAGPATLYGSRAFGREPGHADEFDIVTRPVYSPFEPDQRVGQITLYASHAEIHAQAAANSRYTTWILGFQVSIVAAAVAFLVYFLVTRPIKRISDELHRLEVSSGMHLSLPSGRRSDEIGQLVLDVNALIAQLTDLIVTERDLRMAHEVGERRMRLVFEKADTGILVVDDQGAIQSSNPAFVRILGPAAAVPGAPLGALLAPCGERVAELISASLKSGQPRDTDLEIDVPGRGKLWIELSVNPLGPNLLQGLLNDISERKRAEKAAHDLAAHDALTGMLNRRGIDDALARLFAPLRAGRHAPFALLQIDLDYFKAVNDTYGHEAGDRVLREVARVLQRSVRRSDVVGRIGGDEFVAILPGIEDAAQALVIANGIIAGIKKPIDIERAECAHVSASIGIAIARDATEAGELLMQRADAAMYGAKQAGRGRACIAMVPQLPAPETAAA